MKILYLCPNLNFDKSTGGAHAHKYFIDLFNKTYPSNLKIIGFSENHSNQSDSYINLNHLKKSIFTIIFDYISNIFLPYKLVYLYSKKSNFVVKSEILKDDFDVLILDHFDCLSMIKLSEIFNIKKPIIYISHNVESKALYDISSMYPLWNIKYYIYKFDSVKARFLENKLLAASSLVIFLSNHDMLESSNSFRHKYISHIPSLAPLANINSNKVKNNSIFFSMNFNYKPNVGAFNWIVNNLSEEIMKINPSINIIISGVPSNVSKKYKKNPTNLIFLDYLPYHDYLKIYNSVDIFICPIKYGSGVKMKIVEALRNNIFVLAFEESFRGLNLSLPDFLLSQDSKIAAERIDFLLTNYETLKKLKENQISYFRDTILFQKNVISAINSL